MRDENPARDFGFPRFAATLLFVVLIAYPFSRILQRADFSSPIPPELFSIAKGSLVQAGWSLFASLAIGIPLGILYAAAWSSWIRGLSIASFSMPSLLVVGMFATFLRGTEYRFGLAPVVVAHAYLNIPWIAVATAEGIRSLPQSWLEAARTLGATRVRAFLRIELPWVAKRISLAAAQVFALCLTSFAVVMVLGGGPPVETLETEIFAAVRGAGLSLSKAAWFSVAELALAALPLLFVASLRSSSIYRDSLSAPTGDRRASPGVARAATLIAVVWFFLPGFAFLPNASVARLA